jgi:signal transduction histidine kinase
MTIQTESHTRFHGRWLIIARLAWITAFIALTLMYALGFLAAQEALSTVCEKETCTLRQQVRHTDAGDKLVSWSGPPIGFADRLRPDQVNALKTLGLTLDQYGWLGALQMGLPVLVYLLIAAGLFLRKSDDWMVLFASVMVATLPIGNGPLPFILMVRQPAWEWVFDSASVVGLSCFLIFPLIFPTGRFVPRWTRWMAVFAFTGAVAVTLFQNSIMESPGAGTLVRDCVVISLATGVYAQLYRYFHVASPGERQQLKWVIVGLAGFVSIASAVLLPLNNLMASRAADMDPARVLVLSVIPDAIFQAILLFIPLSIAISVLRYRLWDIDIIISRTLVYGTLTTSVVGLYVLIVGGFGILFQMQSNLPGIIIAILLIAFLFQPLRRRLQDIVNHFVPLPKAVISPSIATPVPLSKLEQKAAVTKDTPNTAPHGRWLALAHWAWLVCAALALLIFFVALPRGYALHLSGSSGVPIDAPAWYVVAAAFTQRVASLLATLVSLALAGVIFWKKRDDPGALFISFYLLVYGVIFAPLEALNGFTLLIPDGLTQSRMLIAPKLISTIQSGVGSPLGLLLLYLFPNGRFVPSWTRYTTLPILLFAPTLGLIFGGGRTSAWTPMEWFILGIYTVLVGIGVYAQIYRYRRLATSVEKQQTKVVVFGFMLVVLMNILLWFPYVALSKIPQGVLHPWWDPLNGVAWWVTVTIIPLSLGISVMRYRLWDIDILINRALVYGTLSAGIVALYVLLVGILSLFSQTTGNLLVSLLATGLIAFLIQPLRERLQRAVNRLMYGERDDPYVALSRLGRRLEVSLAPDAVLPTVVTTVREVLKLPYVAIYLQQDSHGYKIVAESASPSLPIENGRIRVPGMNREGLCIPLIHQGETLGYIVLGPRAPNEAFSSTDLRLLDDIAPQVGVAVHAVRLTADLQRSREQLVLAREEERRRLRRDLHDDLAPTLASLGLTASTAADLISTDPTTATQLVKELQTEIRATVGNIRRLVYDLRPPTLDELGLLAAIRERAAQYSNAHDGVHMIVDAPAELPALPAAVEVAAYRIVQEALENVSKHSQARQCAIRFANHDGLEIEITDDGMGLPQSITPGVGLRSMRERAEELGGSCVIERGLNKGTRVLARLPIGEFNGSIARPDRG